MNKNLTNRRKFLLSRSTNQYPWNLSKLKQSAQKRKWARIKFTPDLLKSKKFFKFRLLKTYENKSKMLFRRFFSPGVTNNQFKKLFKFKNRYRSTFRQILKLEHRFDTLVYRIYMLKNIGLARFCILNNFFSLNKQIKLSPEIKINVGDFIEINSKKIWQVFYANIIKIIASIKKYYYRIFFKMSYPFIPKRKRRYFKEHGWKKQKCMRFFLRRSYFIKKVWVHKFWYNKSKIRLRKLIIQRKRNKKYRSLAYDTGQGVYKRLRRKFTRTRNLKKRKPSYVFKKLKNIVISNPLFHKIHLKKKAFRKGKVSTAYRKKLKSLKTICKRVQSRSFIRMPNNKFYARKSWVLLKTKVKPKKRFKAILSTKAKIGSCNKELRSSSKKIRLKSIYKKIKYLMQNYDIRYMGKPLATKRLLKLNKKVGFKKATVNKQLPFATSLNKQNQTNKYNRFNKSSISTRVKKPKKSKLSFYAKTINAKAAFNKKFRLKQANTKIFGWKGFKPNKKQVSATKGNKTKKGSFKKEKNYFAKRPKKFNRKRPTWWKRRWVYYYWQKKRINKKLFIYLEFRKKFNNSFKLFKNYQKAKFVTVSPINNEFYRLSSYSYDKSKHIYSVSRKKTNLVVYFFKKFFSLIKERNNKNLNSYLLKRKLNLEGLRYSKEINSLHHLPMSILSVLKSKGFFNITLFSLNKKFANLNLTAGNVYKVLNVIVHNILQKVGSLYTYNTNITVFKKYLIRVLILMSKVQLRTIIEFKDILTQKGNLASFKYPENFHTKLIISNKPIIPELIKHVQIKLGATNYLVTRPVNRLKFVSKLKRKHLLIVGSFRKVGNTKMQILFQEQNYTYSRIQIEYKKINLVLKYRPFPLYYVEINYNTLCFSITSGFDFIHFPYRTLLNFTDISHYYSR